MSASLAKFNRYPYGIQFEQSIVKGKNFFKRILTDLDLNQLGINDMTKLISTKTLFTGLHSIDMEEINLDLYLKSWIDNEFLPGGYFDFIDSNNIVFVSGEGMFYLFEKQTKIVSKIESNLNEYLKKQNFKSVNEEGDDLSGRFGVRDIFFDKNSGQLFVSHFVKIKDDDCFGLEISKSKVNNNFTNLNFSSFFKTSTCASNFNSHSSGGRILRKDDKIIFTIGDLDQNEYGDRNIPQSRDNFIGKVVEIDMNGKAEILSYGHRNQQGLTLLDDQIYISEHMAMGGDEINKIEKGRDYGWPYKSYGFSYFSTDKYEIPHYPDYTDPEFYFNPSIGISEMIFYEDKMFKRWTSNLLVSSLRDESIYRIQYDKNLKKFISSERIYIGKRIRDLIIDDDDGSIWIMTDNQSMIHLTRSITDIPYSNENNLLEIKKSEISYKDIEPILSRNCIGCHNQVHSIKLNNFENVLISIKNPNFIKSILHEPGYQKMPPNKKLEKDQLDLLLNWIDIELNK